jgi:hypothetical protein
MFRTFMLLLLAFSSVPAAVSAVGEPGPHKKITGVYRIYGGGLGDPTAPSTNDKKIMFSVKGKMAKEIFDAIGPDRHNVCSEGTADRARMKDNENLLCIRTEQGEYFCNFGFDLKTGKSIGGIVC